MVRGLFTCHASHPYQPDSRGPALIPRDRCRPGVQRPTPGSAIFHRAAGEKGQHGSRLWLLGKAVRVEVCLRCTGTFYPVLHGAGQRAAAVVWRAEPRRKEQGGRTV